MQLTHKPIGFTAVVAVITCVIYALGTFHTPLLKVALWVLVPCSSILIFFKTGQVLSNVYQKYLFALVLWSLITALTAYDQEIAWVSIQQMVGTLLFSYILFFLARSYNTSYCVALIYILYLINCIIYAQSNILSVIDEIGTEHRLGDERLNSNIFGYFLLISTFFVYHLGIVTKLKAIRVFWQYAFVLLLPLSFYIAILTASRQILLLQVPYFAILLYHRYWKSANISVRLIFLVLLIVCTLSFSDYIFNSYENSYLAKRSEVSVEEDPRATLAQESFLVGCENPIFGVGPGNFRLFSTDKAFSHNSFLELFANSGIIAVAIYVAMLYTFVATIYKSWRKDKSDVKFNLLWFGVFYVFDNIFYVFYTNTWLIGIFMFVASVSMNKNNSFYNQRLTVKCLS